MTKPKRSILNVEGLNAQIATTTQAFNEVESQTKHQKGTEKKEPGRPQGRPAKKPPCGKITIELPLELIDRLTTAADHKTGGNRTILIERILKGDMTL